MGNSPEKKIGRLESAEDRVNVFISALRVMVKEGKMTYKESVPIDQALGVLLSEKDPFVIELSLYRISKEHSEFWNYVLENCPNTVTERDYESFLNLKMIKLLYAGHCTREAVDRILKLPVEEREEVIEQLGLVVGMVVDPKERDRSLNITRDVSQRISLLLYNLEDKLIPAEPADRIRIQMRDLIYMNSLERIEVFTNIKLNFPYFWNEIVDVLGEEALNEVMLNAAGVGEDASTFLC